MSKMKSLLGLAIAGAMLPNAQSASLPLETNLWGSPKRKRTREFNPQSHHPTKRRLKVKLARKQKLKNQKR